MGAIGARVRPSDGPLHRLGVGLQHLLVGSRRLGRQTLMLGCFGELLLLRGITACRCHLMETGLGGDQGLGLVE